MAYSQEFEKSDSVSPVLFLSIIECLYPLSNSIAHSTSKIFGSYSSHMSVFLGVQHKTTSNVDTSCMGRSVSLFTGLISPDILYTYGIHDRTQHAHRITKEL